MIKLKRLISEIAFKKSTPIDDFLKKEINKVFSTPPKYSGDTHGKEFVSYLEELQAWAKKNIPEYGILLDIPNEKLFKPTKDLKSKKDVYSFDDDYDSFEDFFEDQFGSTDYVLISPGHVAKYLFGEDLASRIVVPGRGPTVSSED